MATLTKSPVKRSSSDTVRLNSINEAFAEVQTVLDTKGTLTADQTWTGTNIFAKDITIRRTGNGASFIAERTDGVVGTFQAGLSGVVAAFEEDKFFAIADNTRSNILDGTAGSAGRDFLKADSLNDYLILLGEVTAGKVGIGETSPSAKLHLAAGTSSIAPLKLNSGTKLTTPQSGAVEFDGNSLYFTTVNTRRAATIANGIITGNTTVANTTTETTAFTEEIAAGELHAGQRVRVFVDGIYSTANASDTFTLRVKVGGTTVATLVSTAANVTDAAFSIEFAMTVRTSGSSGSAVTKTTGFFDDEIKQAASASGITLNTNIAEDVTVTVQWSAANPGNTLTVQQGHAEFIN